MGKPNLTRKAIADFMEKFMLESLAIPSAQRVSHEFQEVPFELVETTMDSLLKHGALADTLEEMRTRQWESRRAANTNRPDFHTATIIRSGVREVSKKVLETKAYSVDVLSAKFPDGMKVQFAFTVDHTRGFGEYLQVKEQSKREGLYTEYGASLLSGMFRKWT